MSESSQTQVGKTASNQSSRTNAAEATFCRKMVVTVVSGALMSFWSPLSVLAINSDLKNAGLPMTPYGEYLIFCFALMLSTLMLVPAILAYPLEGGAAMPFAPAVRAFRDVPLSTHGLCLAAGVIWGIGGNANIVGAASQDLSPAVSYGIGQAAPMMAIFWGVFFFREFSGTST